LLKKIFLQVRVFHRFEELHKAHSLRWIWYKKNLENCSSFFLRQIDLPSQELQFFFVRQIDWPQESQELQFFLCEMDRSTTRMLKIAVFLCRVAAQEYPSIHLWLDAKKLENNQSCEEDQYVCLSVVYAADYSLSSLRASFNSAKPCSAVHAWLTQLWTLELQHPDPIGYGLARECFLEPAGPDCIIPGQPKPIRLLGFQVHSWIP
jgi:hypothetical protein